MNRNIRCEKQNKLLLPFKAEHPVRGEMLIQRFVKAVCASEVAEILVVLGHEAEKIKSVLLDLPLRFVENPRYTEGLMTSIQAGVSAASPQSEGLMICLSDMPFVETADFNRLIHAFYRFRKPAEKLIILPTFAGQRGNPVLFSAEFRQEILQHKSKSGTSDVGCRGIVRKHQECVQEIIMENDHVLRDVDTREDYEALN